jgi:hypothetical protein
MNLFKYNETYKCYEHFDKVNLQLTVYTVEVGEYSVTVTRGVSSILQESKEVARKTINWKNPETFGIEFINILNHSLHNKYN